MIDMNRMLKDIEGQIKDEAKIIFSKNLKEAVKDSQKFLKAMKADLERWTVELAAGRMTKDEYKSMVEGAKDVGEMHALKQKGIGLIAINKFKDKIIAIVIDKTLSMLP
jgi:hypothetical protein